MIFRNYLNNTEFPNSWKKLNILLIHKKRDKQITNNYHPLYLLPTCDKLFEKLIFNSLHSFLDKNGMLNQNQSGVQPFDSSCMYQLTVITHQMFQSFEYNPSLWVTGIFLDICKALV